MTKKVTKVDKKGKPDKEFSFIQTRKIARQVMKSVQGNNKISKKWNEAQSNYGAGFWKDGAEK